LWYPPLFIDGHKQGKKKSRNRENIETFLSLFWQRMMFQKTGQ